ncbi:MAG TPA: hypothetical protein PKC19_23740, partial [Roseiflexaceae bacterium]|nr:hypothetical protein [Roseiflexaceae bacterium]
IIQPLTIAAMNAVLLTGDLSYLDIPRAQLDLQLDLGRVEDGKLLVPHRYTDAGWTAYRPLSAEYALQIWQMSQSEADAARLERFPERTTAWREVRAGRGKGDDIHIAPWYCYVRGELPDYPQHILDAQWAEVLRRMDKIRADDTDPEEWDVHHWQDLNPVHTEALIQLTCGAPQIIYHGGFLHVRLCYHDALARRPGLPPDVAALVHRIDADGVDLTLTNLSVLDERVVIVQAGAFGEHHFRSVTAHGSVDAVPHAVDGPYLRVVLPPGRTTDLRLAMRRYAGSPGYRQPSW